MTDQPTTTTTNGRKETWLDLGPTIGAGYVCGEPDQDKPDGICGMPTESEPCTIHHPDGDDQDEPSLYDQVLGILSADLTREQTATAIRDHWNDWHDDLLIDLGALDHVIRRQANHIDDLTQQLNNAASTTATAWAIAADEIRLDAAEHGADSLGFGIGWAANRLDEWAADPDAIAVAETTDGTTAAASVPSPRAQGAVPDAVRAAAYDAVAKSWGYDSYADVNSVQDAEPKWVRDAADAVLAVVAASGGLEPAAARVGLSAADRELIAAVVAEVRNPGALPDHPPLPDNPNTAQLLRAAAAGRREYAANINLPDVTEKLELQADTLDQAAKVAEGDLGPLYNWLPSWRWTPEMHAALDSKPLTANHDDPAAEPDAMPDPDRPLVVAICGSTRFRDQMATANRNLTLAGSIVVAPGVFAHQGDLITDDQKTLLDDLHKRKIDLADTVYVVNPGGYIGDSTRSEIAYAVAAGKPVRYLEPLDADPDAEAGRPVDTVQLPAGDQQPDDVLTAEPGPEVTEVWDRDGDRWIRNMHGGWSALPKGESDEEARQREGARWDKFAPACGPFTTRRPA